MIHPAYQTMLSAGVAAAGGPASILLFAATQGASELFKAAQTGLSRRRERLYFQGIMERAYRPLPPRSEPDARALAIADRYKAHLYRALYMTYRMNFDESTEYCDTQGTPTLECRQAYMASKGLEYFLAHVPVGPWNDLWELLDLREAEARSLAGPGVSVYRAFLKQIRTRMRDLAAQEGYTVGEAPKVFNPVPDYAKGFPAFARWQAEALVYLFENKPEILTDFNTQLENLQ